MTSHPISLTAEGRPSSGRLHSAQSTASRGASQLPEGKGHTLGPVCVHSRPLCSPGPGHAHLLPTENLFSSVGTCGP